MLRSFAVTALLIGIGCAASSAGAERIALVDALERLRQQGYDFIYSNDLVTSSLYVEVGQMTLDEVRAALPGIGLQLVRQDDVWLVVRAPSEPPAAPSPVAAVTPAATGSRLETVIVTGSRHLVPTGLAGASTSTISAAEMNVTPALAGDAMRVINRLPGMSSVGISAKPQVRGGVQNETLILLDGIELIDPFHLADFQSIFSSVDDRTVAAIDVYTGGFPARYGNRMSGVMEISTLAPDAPRTELGLSLFSAFANTRGNTADGGTNWLVSARRGNLELLVDWLDDSYGAPKYDDAYARVGRRFGDKTIVYVGGHVTRDNISITDNAEVATSDIDTTYLWTRVEHVHSDALRGVTTLSTVSSDRDKTERNGEPDVSVGFLDYTQEYRKYGMRTDFSYERAGLLMEFGAQADYSRSQYHASAVIERGPVGEILDGGVIDAFDFDTAPSGWSGGAYWSAEYALSDCWVVQPGVRWDFQDYYANGMDARVSPRLGLRYQPSDALTVRAAVGRYYQPQAIYEMQATDGVDELFSPQRADHYLLGVEWDSQYWIKWRAEAYYKDYQPTRTRYENVFDTFVLLPELEPDRVALTPSRARVVGVDLQARFEFLPNLSGVLRGSHMNADDRIAGEWIARRWSQHYTAQGMLVWEPGDSSAVALAYTWHSGWRTTPMPPRVPVGVQIPLTDILNRSTVDDFVSVDISARKSWHVGRATITAHADITNVFNHTNIAGIDYEAVETDTDIFMTPNPDKLLPWIPSVGVIIAF